VVLSQLGNRADVLFDSGIACVDVKAQCRDRLACGYFVHQPVDGPNHDSAMSPFAIAREFSPTEFPNSWSSLPLCSYYSSFLRGSPFY
jgi:hypothetical protein